LRRLQSGTSQPVQWYTLPPRFILRLDKGQFAIQPPTALHFTPVRLQSLVEDAAGWSDVWTASARLFSDHQDGCRRRAFAENELRRIEVQRAAFALRCLFRHLRQFRCVGAFNTAYQFAGFRIQGRAGEWFPSALLAYPARRPVHLDPGRNNAVDPAKILAVTFQGVLRTVRWRPQPVPGLFRDLPIVRLRYCAGCGRDRDLP
jgi:hypothetical protein